MGVIGQHLGPASCSGTVITAATSSIELLPDQSRRVKFSLYNDSTAFVFVRFGSGVASNNFSMKMSSGSFYEMADPIYTGSITGIWTAETGSMMVTVWRSVEPGI